MTVLTIQLPDGQKVVLAAKAQAKGLSAEEYVADGYQVNSVFLRAP